MIWLHHHWMAFLLALQRLRAAPLNTVLSVLAIGVALALPAGGQLLIDNSVQFARNAAPAPQISIYLRMEAEDAGVKQITSKLANHAAVLRSDFLSREATLARFKASEGLRDVIDVLPKNPFPHAFVITPRDDTPAAMDELASELRSWPGIDHVQLDSDWIRRLDALLRFARSAVLALALMLGVGLVTITFNITRLQVLTQREEITVSELLGATPSFIRRPFLYFGSVLGVLGGALAWLMVFVGERWLRGPLQEIAELYGLAFQIVGLGAMESRFLLLLAGVLGGLGTALSLRQYLR